jgi:glucose 1-dehydrogenase
MKQSKQVVFITDADSKSGQAIIQRFTSERVHFILNSFSGGSTIQHVISQCQASGSKVEVVRVDLCKRAEVELVLEHAAAQLGSINVFVHNNNVVFPTRVETSDEQAFYHIMDANAKSAFICTQAVGQQMIARKSGKIIYIGSIHAEKPTGASFAYSASKGALKMLARETALLLGRHGINVNVIELGPIEGDDIVFQSEISTLYDDYRTKVPNAVLGTHEDLAHLVYFLASEEARYINGSDIRLDGGFLQHYMDFKMKVLENEGGERT